MKMIRSHLYLQCSHIYSDLIDLRCFLSAHISVKAFLQTSQAKGFSPRWRRRCELYESLFRKALPHISHFQGFTPKNTYIWDEPMYRSLSSDLAKYRRSKYYDRTYEHLRQGRLWYI